jgi:hypothetical protein
MRFSTFHTFTIIEQYYVDNRQESFIIMKMKIFAIFGKVKPDVENTRHLNLVVVTCMTVQVSKLPW